MGANEQGANATEGRWLVTPRTLCFVMNGDDILLMKHAPHKRVFPNRYNGVGGHIERDEDPLTSARREIAEETGLTVRNLTLRAIYNIDAGAASGIILFIFFAVSDSRKVIENSEGTLHWVNKNELFNLDLVEDIPQILPRILDLEDGASPFFVHLSYDNQDQILMRFAEI